jgi:hypothetical protein
MKKRAFLLVFGIFIAVSPKLHAETTEVLLSNCRPVTQAKVNADGSVAMDSSFENGFCWGAFATIDQMLMAQNSRTKTPIFNVCLPKDHTRYQMIAIFVRYAEKHPERYNEDSPWVAFDAAREVFPCKS